MTEENWAGWFPANTDAWRDFHQQLTLRPGVKNALGIARAGYAKASHPRDLGEPWYVDPAQGAERPRKGYLERREEEDAGRGPRMTQEQVRASAGEYVRSVGKERRGR